MTLIRTATHLLGILLLASLSACGGGGGGGTSTDPITTPTIIENVVVTSATTINVLFTRGIDSASLTDVASQFVFDNGLIASSAVVNGNTVTLTTSTQTSGATYNLTVAVSVQDILGVAVDSTGGNNTWAVTGYTPSAVSLIINEVDYDQPGTDTTEFVEIYNISGSTIDLTDYQLVFVNGLDETVYLTTEPFAGSLLPGDYYVYGSSAVPGVDQTPLATETNIIQNGAPDGIRLERISTGEVIDSLAYEGTMTTAGEGSGDTGLADDGASDNVSLCRIPDGVDTDDNVADMMSCLSSPGVANSVSP